MKRQEPLSAAVCKLPIIDLYCCKDEQTKIGDAMHASPPERFSSVPRATGAVARLASARLREFGKDVEAVLAKVGARPEQVNDDAVRLEVPKQIRILEFAAEELRMDFLDFIWPAILISAKSGWSTM